MGFAAIGLPPEVPAEVLRDRIRLAADHIVQHGGLCDEVYKRIFDPKFGLELGEARKRSVSVVLYVDGGRLGEKFVTEVEAYGDQHAYMLAGLGVYDDDEEESWWPVPIDAELEPWAKTYAGRPDSKELVTLREKLVYALNHLVNMRAVPWGDVNLYAEYLGIEKLAPRKEYRYHIRGVEKEEIYQVVIVARDEAEARRIADLKVSLLEERLTAGRDPHDSECSMYRAGVDGYTMRSKTLNRDSFKLHYTIDV